MRSRLVGLSSMTRIRADIGNVLMENFGTWPRSAPVRPVSSSLLQLQREDTPFPVLTLHEDAPTDQLCQLLAEVQAETGAVVAARRGGIQLGKGVEQLRLVVRFDPAPG